jgi:multiple sugar transport system substrate-binding protein
MREKFLMEVVVGKTGAFDVLQFDGPSIAEFVEGGGLEPIDPYVSSKDLSDFYPSALEPCEYKGKLYGLPYLVHDQILYYRTDLFKAAGLDPDRPPETWDELVDYAIKLTKNGVYGFVVEGKGPGHPEVPTKFLDFLYAAGGSIFADDERDFSTVTLDSPAGYEAMQFMVDLLHKYKVCPPGALGFDCADVHTMFMQGILAMAHNWPYQFGLANDPKASKVVGLFDVALMPRKRRIAGAAYAWFLAIPSSSRNKDSAWKFIEFMTSTEELKGLNLYNPGPIPRKSTAKLIQEDPEVPELTKKFIRVCTEMVEHGITNAVKHPKYAVIKDDIIGAAISEALSLKKTAKEAIDDAAAKIRALIKA